MCHGAKKLRRPRTNSKLPMRTNPILECLVSLTLSPRLVKKGKTQNFIRCKWVYRIKRNPDGFIARYKARLGAKGFH